MAEGFEIKVPITIKGGREGENVGKQIGSKIAEQIKKSFRAIGIGATKGEGEAGKMASMSGGLGKLALKMGIIAGILGSILLVLKKSSPYLRGILSIFGRAFMMFFRPFGDFLATLLKPLALVLLKLAAKFLGWSRSPEGQKLFDPKKFLLGGGMPGYIVGLLKDKFMPWLWENLKSIWKWTYDFGGWLWEKMIMIWNYAQDFGNWIWNKLISIWNYAQDFGNWIWNNLKGIWNYAGDLGKFLIDKLKTIWNYEWNFGNWLQDKLKSLWDWDGWSFWGWLQGRIIEAFGEALFAKIFGFQTGTSFVPETGLYKLHRGEQVIPRNQVNHSKTTVFRPVFQITATGSQGFDPDEVARRASRMFEMQLKSKGII